jgi:malate permease and related proteins
VQQLWSISAVSVLMIHNLGVELSIWTIGVMLMSGDKKIPWGKLINGPTTSVVIGLTLVFLNVDHHVVGPMRDAMKWLGSGAFPLALLVTGCLLIDTVKIENFSWRIVLGGSIVRLGIVPVLILCCAKFLPISIFLKQVLIVQAAMPAATSPLLIAKLYNGRPGVAAQVLVSTTVLSLITLPLLIGFGIKWVFP